MAGAASASCQTSLTAGLGARQTAHAATRKSLFKHFWPCMALPLTPRGEKRWRRCKPRAQLAQPGAATRKEAAGNAAWAVQSGSPWRVGGSTSHGGTAQGSFPLHPCGSLHFVSGLWCRTARMELPGRASCPLVSPHRAQQAPGTRVCMRLCEEARVPPLSWGRDRAAARPSHSPGTSTLLSSLSSLHPLAPCVAQDLFHHLEKSIYCQ